MNVEAFVKFQKLVASPPKQLFIGDVGNTVSQHSYDYDCPQKHSTTLSSALRLALDGADEYPRFYHNDSEPMTPTIQVKKRDSWCGNYWEDHSLSDTDVLMKHAAPAPYGDLSSGETKVDTDVRQCYHVIIPEAKTEAKIRMKPLPKSFTERIQSILFPNRQICLEFNKINIYNVGGHFSRHVDTPKPDVVGTLVIFGDDHYEGGDLVLDDNGIERRFNGGYVAFYSSIPHWVEPVTKGTRVTATYYIKQVQGTGAVAEADTTVEVPHPVLDTLKKQPFGVVLSEIYSKSEDDTLKGDDMKLSVLLPHFNVEFLPVLVDYTDKYYDPEDITFGAKVYRCTEADFDSYCKGELYAIKAVPQLPCCLMPDIEDDSEGVIGGQTVRDEQQGFIEHVGNECQPGFINNVYFSRLAIFRSKLQKDVE